jgi:hypothetical protein
MSEATLHALFGVPLEVRRRLHQQLLQKAIQAQARTDA